MVEVHSELESWAMNISLKTKRDKSFTWMRVVEAYIMLVFYDCDKKWPQSHWLGWKLIILFFWNLEVYSYSRLESRLVLLETLRRTCSFIFPRFSRSLGSLFYSSILHILTSLQILISSSCLLFLPWTPLRLLWSHQGHPEPREINYQRSPITSAEFLLTVIDDIYTFQECEFQHSWGTVISRPHIHIYRLEESSGWNISWQFYFVNSTTVYWLPY